MAKSGKAKTKIFSSTDKCMSGAELRRLRKLAGLSQGQLADKLKGWGWYKTKVVRYERSKCFCICPLEMQALLDVLGAVSF